MEHGLLDVGQGLTGLLAEMSPDEPKINSDFSYPEYVFGVRGVLDQELSRGDVLKRLLQKINFYTHSEYFLQPAKLAKPKSDSNVGDRHDGDFVMAGHDTSKVELSTIYKPIRAFSYAF